MPIINPINTGPSGFLGEELNNKVDQVADVLGLSGPLSYPSSYEFIKRFIQIPSDISGGDNGVTSLDDPTYLGFQLLFLRNSPLFNGALEGETELPENLVNSSPTESFLNSASTQKIDESAVGYLEQIGETNRAKYLRAFAQGLFEIIRTRPYYFQSIEGLTDAWQKSADFSDDPYIGAKEGEGITIGCLEAIDLKLTALFTLYKMAVYDSNYRRYVLPKNLMEFDVYVYVSEIRKFNTTKSKLISLSNNQGDNSTNSSKFIGDNTSQISFKFRKCIWDISSIGKTFDTVTNSNMEIATTEIKFSYSNILFQSQFSGYNSSLDEGKKQRPSDSSSNIEKYTKDVVLNQAESSVNSVAQRARAFGQSQVLGNAFGLRNQALGIIENPQGLANALNGAALTELRDINSPNIPQKLGDKILPSGQLPTNNDGTEPRNISGSDRLFTKVPPGPPLNNTNIFE